MNFRVIKAVSMSTVFFIALIFFLPGTATSKAIKWRATTVWTPAIKIIEADRYFVKTVNELCKGELEITLYPAPQIVPSFEVFEAVRNGTVKLGFDWAGYWAGKNTAFGALGGLPSGPIQQDITTWIIQGGGDQAAMDLYGKYNMLYFFHSVIPAESGLRGNKPFLKAEDFKGAKIRMSGMLQGKILKDLGASQVMLAGQEIYQALEKGVIDAAEFSTPDNDWNLGLQEVTTVWNTPGWHQPASPVGMMVNKKAWDALPVNIQEKFKVATLATLVWSSSYFNYQGALVAKKFIDKGVKIYRLDDATLNEIQALSYKHILEEAKKNPDFAKVAYLLFNSMEKLDDERTNDLSLLKREITLPDMKSLAKAANIK